jgi:hypothetical protein
VPSFGIGGEQRTDSRHIITKSGTDLGASLAVVQWAGNTAGTWGNDIVFAKSYSGTVGSHTAGSDGNLVTRLLFEASDGTNFVPAASIQVNIDGTPGTNDMPGRLVFSTTADGASSPTEQLRITSNRYVRLASGTGGIQFNGDTAAANALDDYEEGTWTPSVGGTATYSSRAGSYVKIGSLVFAQFDITINVLGTGTQTIGAPFTGVGSPSGSIGYYYNLATSIISLRPYIGTGGTIYFANTSSATVTSPNLPTTIFGDGSRVQGTIIYTV